MAKTWWAIKIAVVGLFIAFAGASACRKTPSKHVGWYVSKGPGIGMVVAWIDDKPGKVTRGQVGGLKQRRPPPGTPVIMNPFMTMNTTDGLSEGALQKLAEQSTSFQDFVDKLEKEGYRVEPWGGSLD